MAKNGKKVSSWRDKYRISILKDKTFKEVWTFRITKYNAFLIALSTLLLIIGITSVLIFFTGIREFIPGYPDGNMRRNIIMNAILLDSLEYELELRDRYFENLQDMIAGREPRDIVNAQDSIGDYESIEFSRSLEDSLLRQQIEQEEQYNLTVGTSQPLQELTSLSRIHLFPPVKGLISGSFDVAKSHYGTDIVSQPSAVVSSVLDGTVILASWTMETGYVIQIQHANNLVSVYKHNATLLKESGDQVKAGETIAIIGNSGELYTSGPHLHFELWRNGEPLDPEKYILF